MKCKKVFSLLAVSAVAISLLAFSARPAQGQLGGVLSAITNIDELIRASQDTKSALQDKIIVLDDFSRENDFVGKTADSILSNIRAGIVNVRQISGMDYDGNTLRFGEEYRHTWKFRDEGGNVEYVDAKGWKFSYTNGEAKFVLVLNDDQEQEYPTEELYEDDLKYLFEYLVDRLDELSKLSGENGNTIRDGLCDITDQLNYFNKEIERLLVSINSINDRLSLNDAELSQNVGEMQAQLSQIQQRIADRKPVLQLSFRHINNVLTLVNIGLMTIEPGTEAGQELKLAICGETLTFRWCPAGEFTRQAVIGQQTAEKEEWYGRDRYGRRIKFRKPRTATVTEDVKGEQHVTLSEGFWILDSEVTRRMYYWFMGYRRVMNSYLPYLPYVANDYLQHAIEIYPSLDGPVTLWDVDGSLPIPLHPAAGFTWNEANEFCKRLNEITTKNFALPTEAQWQYACRADGSSVDLDLVAWHKANSGSEDQSVSGRQYRRQLPYQQHEVKTKEPNAWGIYDMLGNVSEWCADWEGTETPAETAVDPTGPETGEKRVVCGGNFTSPAENCVFDYTVGNLPNQKVGTIGFRVILIPDPPKEDTMSETADEETAEETDHLNGFESTDDNAEVPEDVDAENKTETETAPEAGNASDTSESADAAGTKNEVEKAESGNTGRGKPAI